MDDAHDAEPEEPPYIRLPWALVAAALAGVLLLALGIGLYANRYLRPQLGVQVAPTAIAIEAAQLTNQQPALTAAPTVAPTPTAALPAVAAPTQAPATATNPTEPLTTIPPRAAEPTPSLEATAAVATPRPTVSPELATEVADAYVAYWQVRAEALYNLDTSRLGDVMAGEHLAAVEDRINELRSVGQAFETDVDHNYVVFEATADEAKVADSYVDHSTYVDLHTRAILTTATDEKFDEVYIMNKTDGKWRVAILVGSP